MAKNLGKFALFLILPIFFGLLFINDAFAQQAYSKRAYNLTQGRNAEEIVARTGDIIEYTLSYYNNTGSSQTITLEDNLDSVMQYADIYRSNDATLSGTMLRFPSVTVTQGTRLDRTFQVKIKTNLPHDGQWSMDNNFGNQVTVPVGSGNSYNYYNSDRWHSAYNQTQNVNAQSVYARPGDFIQYTLSYENRYTTTQTVMMEVDIGDILSLSDLTNYSDASLNGNVLRFNTVSVAPSGRLDRSFQVRVRNLSGTSGNAVMSSFFGNGLDIYVNTAGGSVTNYPIVKGTYTAPQTGPEGLLAMLPAGMFTLGFYLIRRKKVGAI